MKKEKKEYNYQDIINEVQAMMLARQMYEGGRG